MNGKLKTRNVVIFGTGDLSSLIWYCLLHDSQFRPVAFTVDAAYLRKPAHEGLPVVAFEELARHHPPGSVYLLFPLGFHAINGLRRSRYEQAVAQGYDFISYVSSRASTWPYLQVGRNCLIYELAVIQPFSRLGDNVIIRSGAHLSHHCKVGDHAFIAAGATFGGNVTVGEQAFVGVGAVVRDGISIAERSFIGAGAVVIKDTEPGAAYVGNPANKIARSALEITGG
ncbi:MAG: acetyltransferase [Planctomycetes bacterium]|nr:acetyltransferase [Planctomycetota bacterium]